MTYTVVKMEVPRESFLWIKNKLDESGYSHRIGIDYLDMTHIALEPMTGFEFAGNESASLNDMFETLVDRVFRIGFESGRSGVYSSVEDARDVFIDPEDGDDDLRSLFMDAFERIRNELAANLEARNQPYQDIIRRAADLMHEAKKS